MTREKLLTTFWKEFDCRNYDEAMKVLAILQQYNETISETDEETQNA